MKLHLSPMTSSARDTELGRPSRNRFVSEARLVLRPVFARRLPAPGPSRNFTSLALISSPQLEHATIGWLSQPHVMCTSVRGGGFPPASQRSPNCIKATKLG